MASFKVGNNAVYPGHGVGKVTAIETKEIFGKNHEFYTIQILENGMKIMIPKDNVESVGLRPIISREEASGPVTESLAAIFIAVVMIYIGHRAIHGQFSIGNFLSFSFFFLVKFFYFIVFSYSYFYDYVSFSRDSMIFK